MMLIVVLLLLVVVVWMVLVELSSCCLKKAENCRGKNGSPGRLECKQQQQHVFTMAGSTLLKGAEFELSLS